MQEIKYWMVAGCIAISILFFSCMRDKGNYNYKPVEDLVQVRGIDSMYFIDVLNEGWKIEPIVTTMKGEPIDTTQYTFGWYLNQQLGGSDYPNEEPLSTYFNLDIPKDQMARTITNASVRGYLFGGFSVFYRITEKTTGLSKDTYFSVILGSMSYKGWLLLCDDNDGNARLAMVSTLYGDSLIPDILKSLGSQFPTKGTPSFLKVDYQYRYKPGSGPHPFIGTSETFGILGNDTLEYTTPRYDLRNYIKDFPTDENFTGAKFYSSGYLHYLYNKGNFYSMYEYYTTNFVKGNILNDKSFNVSEYMAVYGSGAIVFNDDTKTFLRNPYTEYSLELPPGTLFNFSVNQELRYIEYASTFNGGEMFAILDSTSKINLARFSPGGDQSYYKEITAPDITKATLFAVDDFFGYLFYSVGGKLYQYNMIDTKATLIHDYGNNEITVLKSYTANRDMFGVRFGNIVVCTYNDADPGSGTFDLYTNPALDGSMKLIQSFAKTGKIVDVSYK